MDIMDIMDIKNLPPRRTCRGGPARALSPAWSSSVRAGSSSALLAALLAGALLSAAAPAQGEPKAPPAPNGAGTQPVEAGVSVTISGAPATAPAKVRAMADRLRK